MADNGILVNKVKESGLVTLDLQKFYDRTPIVVFDIADYLFQGLILREKDFRAVLEEFDWQGQFKGKYLAVYCSADAIVAPWAYMLVAAAAEGIAKEVFFGSKESVLETLYERKLESIDWSEFHGKRVLLKGCSDVPVPESAYLQATSKLSGVVERLMYGEACSFVPVYRKPKAKKATATEEAAV